MTTTLDRLVGDQLTSVQLAANIYASPNCLDPNAAMSHRFIETFRVKSVGEMHASALRACIMDDNKANGPYRYTVFYLSRMLGHRSDWALEMLYDETLRLRFEQQ